eukprot:1044672-Rhodomonas_salina.1
MMGLQDEERAAGVLTMAEVVLMKDVNERELERQRNGKGKKGSFASASSEGKRRGRKGSVNSDGKGERGEGVPVIGACFGMEGEDSVEEVGVGTGAKIVQRHGRVAAPLLPLQTPFFNPFFFKLPFWNPPFFVMRPVTDGTRPGG